MNEKKDVVESNIELIIKNLATQYVENISTKGIEYFMNHKLDKTKSQGNKKKLTKRKLSKLKEPFLDKGNMPNLSIENFVVEEKFSIPRGLKITQEQMSNRKCLDIRRWYCMSRPQYAKSCGISSLVSCWNYLFSWLGTGSLKPISQEEALENLGFKGPFTDINFGSITGNETLLLWFNLLNKFYGVKGSSRYYWKMHGRNRTLDIDSNKALQNLETDLKSESKAFIYHCYNHYFCPIGFEITSSQNTDAYKSLAEINQENLQHWIIIGEVSRPSPMFYTRQWEDISLDISNQHPDFFNLRKMERGIRQYKVSDNSKKVGGNIHCILIFEKC